MNRDCKHGQLARSCDRCADEREIADLRREVQELKAALATAERRPLSRERTAELLAEWKKPGGLLDGPFA